MEGQLDIFSTQNRTKRPTCNCGSSQGKKTILNEYAHVGIITEFHDNGVFKNNKACYVENNYCPQCGKKYE